MLIGGLEAGGTKMVCAIGDENGQIFEKISLPTQSPDITIPKLLEFYKDKNIEAIGIGSFGPINLDRNSDLFGCIGNTPKQLWRAYNIYKAFEDGLKVPVGINTDVNGAALGEATWGAGRDLKNVIYITVGTGVGVGVCINGEPLHGLTHPEGGHISVKRMAQDEYSGCCPYHGDCLEGLASGPAIEGRWGDKAYNLTNKPEVWEMESYYIAQAIINYILVLSPDKIVLWGGVMHQTHLFDLVRVKVKTMLNGYIKSDIIEKNIDGYIVEPGLGDEAGIKGAIRLGYLATIE